MKIDLSRSIVIDGVPVVFGDGGKPATLGGTCRLALNAPTPQGPTDVESMVKRGMLAMKVSSASADADLSPEEISSIRASLPNIFQNAEFVAVVYAMLEG
jgi:hypothetical protein